MNISPKFKAEKYQCPHCGVVSQMKWFDVQSAVNISDNIVMECFLQYRSSIQTYEQEAIAPFVTKVESHNKRVLPMVIPPGFAIATCQSCEKSNLWIESTLVHPKKMDVAPPNEDLDDQIKELYLEASAIFTESPRGSTALLRLALQLFLRQIGKPGKNINSDIKELVSEGLSPKLQKALDLLRVVGNNAVHPGQIDLDDNKEIALKLFHVLNFVAEELITKPRELDLLYTEVVPDETKEHINKRDEK